MLIFHFLEIGGGVCVKINEHKEFVFIHGKLVLQGLKNALAFFSCAVVLV